MDQQISRVLTKGLAEGLNPRDIGKNIADRVDKIGRTRGVLIARTETINIHQNAALNEYYSIEKSTGEVVLAQWRATLDSRVRDTHLARNLVVYTKEEAYALLGEPNCRCAILPYIPVTQGMPEKATDAARKACHGAIVSRAMREKGLAKQKLLKEVGEEVPGKEEPPPTKPKELTPYEKTKADWLKAKETLAQTTGTKSVIDKATAAERMAYYAHVETMPLDEYRAVRHECLMDMMTDSAKKMPVFNEWMTTHIRPGMETVPFDVLDQLRQNRVKITIEKTSKNNCYQPDEKLVCLRAENLKNPGAGFSKRYEFTVAHEMFHAIDHMFNGFTKGGWIGQEKMLGMIWRDGPVFKMEKDGKVLREAYTQYIDHFGQETAVMKGMNGRDILYYKGGWVNWYEGRIYEGYGNGVEWITRNAEYNHGFELGKVLYRDKLVKIKADLEKAREMGEKAVASMLEKDLAKLESIGASNYANTTALSNDQEDASREYPVMVDFMRKNFGRYRRLMGGKEVIE
jgi:SPP1 gp7 family putative phage head morphogenesis protein